MTSTRMAGKVLMSLRDMHGVEYPSIIYQAKRLACSDLLDAVVICTSIDPSDDIVKLVAETYHIPCYRGPLDNVLARLYGAAVKHGADTVVDLTGDCPLVDPRHVDAVVERLHRERTAFSSNIEPRAWPDGFDVMAYPMGTLEVLQELNARGDIKHHTGWNCLERGIAPRSTFPPVSERWARPKWGLTLDTWQDYLLLKRVAGAVPLNASAENIIDWLHANPEALKINETVRRKAPSEG